MQVAEGQGSSPVVCGERFPLEIWKMILQQLHNVDKKTIWSFRKVCKDLRNLANEVLKEKSSLWKQNEFPLDGNKRIWTNFLKSVKGTQVCSDPAAVTFLADHWNYGRSPFPNGTLILSPHFRGSNPSISFSMLETFRCIASIYGNDIICLVYTLPDSGTVTTDFLELSEILALKNLRSLAIYKRDWSGECHAALANLYRGPLPKTESVLKELQTFGLNSAIPVAFVFPLFHKAIESVTHLRSSLQIYHNFLDSFTRSMSLFEELWDKEIVNKFVNLRQINKLSSLKFVNLNSHILNKLSTSGAGTSTQFPLLREVTLKYFEGFKLMDVCEVVDLLSLRAPALETLAIDIQKEKLVKAPASALRIRRGRPKDGQEHFPKLNHLIIKLSTILLWKEFMKDLTEYKVANLKMITLVLENYSDVGCKSPKEFYKYLTSDVLNLFPSGLQVIRVPWFGWKLKKGELPDSNFSIFGNSN